MDSQYTRDTAIGRIGKITGLTLEEIWTYYYDDPDRLTCASNASDRTRAEAFACADNDNMFSRMSAACPLPKFQALVARKAKSQAFRLIAPDRASSFHCHGRRWPRSR
jgi:hypothetical protein